MKNVFYFLKMNRFEALGGESFFIYMWLPLTWAIIDWGCHWLVHMYVWVSVCV